MLENNGFYGKTVVFLETNVLFLKQCFLTRLHTRFILIIKHMHFIKIKTIHVLHKFSFHNTIPHRSQSLIGHVVQELDKFSSVLHFSTLKLLLLTKIIAFFQRTYFETVRFSSEMCVKNAKRRPKNITGHYIIMIIILKTHLNLFFPT